MKSTLLTFTTIVTLGFCSGCGRDDNESRSDPETNEPAPTTDDATDPVQEEANLTPPQAPYATPKNDAVARYRGIIEIDNVVRERLIKDDEFSQYYFLGQYLGSYSSEYLSGLPQLLGYFDGDALNSGFQNAEANAINILLWHLVFSSLGTDLANHCIPDAANYIPFQLKADAHAIIESLCTWPSPEARDPATILAFWQTFMQLDANQEEENLFLMFFSSDEYATAEPRQVIRDMTIVAAMNPYFLIHQ